MSPLRLIPRSPSHRVVYLLGVATPPVLAGLVVAGAALATLLQHALTRPRAARCPLCGAAARGPRQIRGVWNHLHARHRHGLALTVAGRVRRRQWHGLTHRYALEHGATSEQWHAALEAARTAASS